MQLSLSNKFYDTLKWVAQILLPAAGTLYFALAQIWNLSNPEQVVGTITAVDAFLGVILGLTAASYQKSGAGTHGNIVVTDGPDSTKYSLELMQDVGNLKPGQDVTFRVTDKPYPE